MQFVIANPETYKVRYAKEHHKYPRLLEIYDLLGCAGVTVIVDNTGEPTLNALELQEQVELLNDFGYCKVLYTDEVGIQQWRGREAGVDEA